VNAYINSLIGNNQLTGGIPSSIRSLTSLQEFDLSTNHLTGPVPDWLADLALMSLWIDTNNFSGQLPLRVCQSLIICSAAFNPHLMCASMSCTCGAMLSCNCNFLCQTNANCVANNGMCSRCVGATPFLNGYCKQWIKTSFSLISPLLASNSSTQSPSRKDESITSSVDKH